MLCSRRGDSGHVFLTVRFCATSCLFISTRKKLLKDKSRDFGSFAEFKIKFSETALGHFGSAGWCSMGKLEIVTYYHDADNPLKL
ncbi:hypothetical protein Pelo_13766 [Pelomyxa schiedti]|nr:hypothetical protein Pelo_13766 [Pelomyxa schiedti]